MSAAGDLSDWLTEAGFGIGWTTIKALPEPAAQRLFRMVADRTWKGQGQGVLQLKANLSRVLTDEQLPRLDEIAHEGVRRYMRYWCEAFRLPGMSHDEILASFRVEREELITEALAEGRGVLMAMPHQGNWDLAAAWASLTYGSLTTVVEHLKPEGLYEKFLDYRRSLGMEVLTLGDPNALRVMARRLKEGKLVSLLTDRDISHHGIPVTFFGEQASMPGGPATLALMTGARMMTASMTHSPDTGLTAHLHDPLPMPEEGTRKEQIQALTQLMADGLARAVRDYPEDWHMMQPLWTADLTPREPAE